MIYRSLGRRRLAMLALLTALGVLLSACGPGANPSSKPTESKTTEAKPAAPAAAPAATTATEPVMATTAAGSPVADAAGLGVIKSLFEGEARGLNGAGATFPAPLYTKWFEEYRKLTGVEVNYQAIGSGGGIKAIADQTVDFGATDGPMTDDQLKAAGAEILHIPMTLGAVVPISNIPELQGQALRFSGETLAGIFLGEITQWDDAKIKADNPNVSLPGKDIIVVHRADGSGTTYIFTDYLSTVSPAWKSKVGTATSVNWPTGLGGQGNPGVTNEVTQNPYAIGYVELIYSIQQKLTPGEVKNKDGTFVKASIENVTAAAAGLAGNIPADLRASIVNAPGATAYPISGFTWILAYKDMPDKPKAIALTRMLYWGIYDGQKFTNDLGYAPLPPDIVKRAEEKILSIQSGGAPAFPGR
jgi:phosphate transport system substrate-binding protein